MNDALLLDKDVAHLRKKLRESEDFIGTKNIFFDRVSANPEFHKLGRQVSFPKLKMVMDKAMCSLYKKKIFVKELHIMHLPSHSLYHGAFNVEGRPAVLFYLEDLDQGMVISVQEDGRSTISRFTLMIIPSAGRGAREPVWS